MLNIQQKHFCFDQKKSKEQTLRHIYSYKLLTSKVHMGKNCADDQTIIYHKPKLCREGKWYSPYHQGIGVPLSYFVGSSLTVLILSDGSWDMITSMNTISTSIVCSTMELQTSTCRICGHRCLKHVFVKFIDNGSHLGSPSGFVGQLDGIFDEHGLIVCVIQGLYTSNARRVLRSLHYFP